MNNERKIKKERKVPEEQTHALAASGFHLGLTMLPFVFLFLNF
jgi:hypothetical protein